MTAQTIFVLLVVSAHLLVFLRFFSQNSILGSVFILYSPGMISLTNHFPYQLYDDYSHISISGSDFSPEL